MKFSTPLFARSENTVKLSLNCLGDPTMAGDASDKLPGYTFLEVSIDLGFMLQFLSRVDFLLCPFITLLQKFL